VTTSLSSRSKLFSAILGKRIFPNSKFDQNREHRPRQLELPLPSQDVGRHKSFGFVAWLTVPRVVYVLGLLNGWAGNRHGPRTHLAVDPQVVGAVEVKQDRRMRRRTLAADADVVRGENWRRPMRPPPWPSVGDEPLQCQADPGNGFEGVGFVASRSINVSR